MAGPRNSIVFRDSDARTLEDEQLGGFGLDDLDQRDTEGYKATAGTLRNPSYGIVDVRLLYNYRLAGYGLELFADFFNLLDDQDATRNQDLLAGAGGNAFGDGIRFTPPRRVFIGARLRFG